MLPRAGSPRDSHHMSTQDSSRVLGVAVGEQGVAPRWAKMEPTAVVGCKEGAGIQTSSAWQF